MSDTTMPMKDRPTKYGLGSPPNDGSCRPKPPRPWPHAAPPPQIKPRLPNGSEAMDATTGMPTVNLELKMAEVEGHEQKVAYMEDADGVFYSIVFPARTHAEAPAELQAKYNEFDYRVMVDYHFSAAVSFIQDRMKVDVTLAHRIVRMLAGY